MLKTALHTETSIAEPSYSLIKQAGIVIGASAVIAVCARLVLPLPLHPSPLDPGELWSVVDRPDAGKPARVCRRCAVPGVGCHGLARVQSGWSGRHRPVVRSDCWLLVGLPGGRLCGWMDRGARTNRICAQPVSGRDCRVGAVCGRPQLAGRDDAQLATCGIFRFVSVPCC